MLNFKDQLLFDFSHQKLNENVLEYFQKVVDTVQLNKSVSEMLNGDMINTSCKWSVLHTALRAPRNAELSIKLSNGETQNVNKDVYEVLDQVKAFTEKVRSGELKGLSGKNLTHF